MPSPRFRRLPVLLALLLIDAGGAALALAESPLPDPIAPAVIGRPLDQIGPVRKPRSAPAKAASPRKPAPSALRKTTAPAAAPQARALPGADPDAPLPRKAKKALDDREDNRVRADDVGKGTHFARKPLGPGAYFGDKVRVAVREYFDKHPVSGSAPRWQIGEALPAGQPVAAVPSAVRASLPKLPPGHQYLQVGGDILLVASGSKMVVDAISAREGR
ncbi:MAG TPA: hypothetical protein VFM98_17335 [Ramlibacter sp.]|uniref:hypothetical protein n=1 Tax=Ramlibacter sp. TaxID=1917967 RepID=UPI002D7FD156|nr:hypothetical protein [Ramlibacter sp.]HET8747366.1 hypothetical protein [Ramlibacter sp.]